MGVKLPETGGKLPKTRENASKTEWSKTKVISDYFRNLSTTGREQSGKKLFREETDFTSFVIQQKEKKKKQNDKRT